MTVAVSANTIVSARPDPKRYTGRLPPVRNWDEATAQVREVYGQWLPGLDDDDFAALARRGFRENEEGVPVLDIDNNIIRIARLSINQVEVSPGRRIRATFNGYDDEACSQ